MNKIIFHVPHDGNTFPDELMQSVIIPIKRFMIYHNAMSDKDVRKLIPAEYASDAFIFPVSRLLCDVERFLDGSECMEQYGMGFCYEKVYDGSTIKRVTDDIKATTMKYYVEHHRRLDDAVLNSTEDVFIIDLHSFATEVVVPSYIYKPLPLPDICLGYDDYCPTEIVDTIRALFEQDGFSVDINYPYSGSLVPNAVMHNKNKVLCRSIMFEINKTAYLYDDKKRCKLQNTIMRICETMA